MPTNEVQLYNIALSNAGSKAVVQSLDEDTVERETCTVHFQASLNEVLEDHDWGFASKFELLAVLKSSTDDVPPPLPWVFEYEYPANCISVREITRDTDAEDEIPFQIGISDDNTAQVIYSDKGQAKARFTRALTNPVLLSPKAVIALGWKLATKIAMPLTGNLEAKQRAEEEYKITISTAKASNFNQGVPREAAEPEAITSRGT